MVPALWSTRRAPAEALQAGGRSGSAGRRVRRWGDALVVGEVALALLLAVGAGLLVRSYAALRAVDPGFEPSGVLAATMYTPVARYDSLSRAQAFYERLVERVRALPGVEGAAVVSQLPLKGLAWTGDFTVAGRPPGQHGTEVSVRSVSPDYFRTLRVPVLSGRPFTDDDRYDAPRVALVNEALARAFFPGGDAVGQRIALDRVPDSTSTWWTIVGVVGNEHQTSPATPPIIEIFAPFAQRRNYRMSLVVRTPGDPLALAPAVRRAVAELDPKLAIASMEAMESVHAGTLARDRVLMTLLLAFAVVGLGLAVVGVYGVLAQLTRGRGREMGIRIALGAPASGVRWLVVGHGLRLTMLGLLIGAGAALVATRAIRGLLYGVLPADPVTFAAVAVVLAATSLAASYGPARKASRSDPVAVMRGE
jgi:putative ABC transport system permease protein